MAAAVPDISRGPVLLSLSSVTASLAFSTTIARFCLRTRAGRKIGPDDYASAVATVVGLIGTIFSIIEGSMNTPSSAMQFDILGQPWIMMAATLSKISICLYFTRLLGRQWRILLGSMIFLMAIVNLTFSMTVNLQCRPLEKLWNPETLGACWNPNVQLNFGYFQGAFSVFSWFFLALFPVMILNELDVQRYPRWPFYVVSGLSFIIGILAIVRTYETSQAGGISTYTFDTFCANLLAIFEQNIGIVAANVLPVGALIWRTATTTSNTTIRGKALSRAESTRSITRVSSGASSSRQAEPSSNRSSIAGPQRLTTFNTDGLRRGAPVSEFELESRTLPESFDPEAWPRGIIKTVSVEVVEEDNPDMYPTREGAVSRFSDMSVEQDWETMLRGGPAPGRG